MRTLIEYKAFLSSLVKLCRHHEIRIREIGMDGDIELQEVSFQLHGGSR